MIRQHLRKPWLLLISRLVLGGLFIYAAADKIVDPLSFAQLVHHYRLMPPSLINIWSVALPWVELVAGILLITGIRVKAAGLILSSLLVIFIIVLSITAVRGIDVACGCFSNSMEVKSNLLLRILEDVGMLLLGLHLVFFHKN